MSYETIYPSGLNLIGNVNVPRNILPTLRSNIRRHDPDITSNVPYIASLAGKTLRINYTKEVSSVVTPATFDIAFTSTSFKAAIDLINTGDSPNVFAAEIDGFLVLQNLNPGKTHLITIAPFTTPSSDAAPLLGFAVDPFPGSTSFAGEIAAAPGSRFQLNPQTTTLISKDETFSSATLNRAFSSTLQFLEDLRAELTRDVVVFKDIPLTFAIHSGDGLSAANINDDSIRVYYPIISPPTAASDLNSFYRILTTTKDAEIVSLTNPVALQATGLFYATSGTPFVTGSAFTTWGTPDGKSIVSTGTPNKDKHASTNITNIQGNIITCSGATFIAKKIKSGDPVLLTASVLQPFDHSGWWSVDAVIDETHLAIRPMAKSEDTPDGSNIRPRWLNSSAAGTLRIAIGRFIPAGNVFVALSATNTGNLIVRAAVGVPFINTLTDDRAKSLSGTLDKLGNALLTHLNAASNAHAATAITGFTSATSWRDTTTISGGNLQQTIEDILTDLKAQATGNSGIGRIGAEVITVTGGAPNTLAQGTILTQLTALLQAIHDHVVLASGAHAATAISYAGGGNWADGTTNPATTVEGQLDKIISDLAPSTGSAKIGGAASGTDIAAGTIAAQTVDLAINWLKMSRANIISAAQTFSALLTANGGFVSSGTTTLSSFILFARSSITLANGNNNDVPYSGSLFVTVNVQSGGGSILTGLVPPSLSLPTIVILANSGIGSYTISNVDTNSVGTNRLATTTGSNLTVPSSGIVTFAYGPNGNGLWFLLCKNF